MPVFVTCPCRGCRQNRWLVTMIAVTALTAGGLFAVLRGAVDGATP